MKPTVKSSVKPTVKQCNICGSSKFKDLPGRMGALCEHCGSYERTRLMKMQIERLFPGLPANLRILHIAPEYGLSKWLSSRFPNYLAADIDLVRYAHIPNLIQIDLCHPRFHENLGFFDLVLHSHVIEHLPCNYTVALLKLHKMIKPGGYHLFSVPIYGKYFDESLEQLDPTVAEQRFGQFDHVRRFSSVDIHRTIGAIFKLPDTPSLLNEFDAQMLEAANIPPECWTRWTGHHVFCVKDTDVLV